MLRQEVQDLHASLKVKFRYKTRACEFVVLCMFMQTLDGVSGYVFT